MKDLLMAKLFMAQLKAKNFVKEALTNEDGDTNFVSIILIIVIVIALATLFKDTLMELAESVLDKLTDFVDS